MKNRQFILLLGLAFGVPTLITVSLFLWGWAWYAKHGPGSSPPGMQEQYVQITPQSMQPYPELLAFDYAAIEFPPFPTTGEVRILTVDRPNFFRANGYPPPNYDVSFQYYEMDRQTKTFFHLERFVALKGSPGAYQVVGNSITFHGPLKFQGDPDSDPQHEYINIANETVQVGVIGTSLPGTHISYRGPDPRLENAAQPLTPADVGPILREWGYDYKIDLNQAGGTAPGTAPGTSPPVPATEPN